MYVSLAQIFDAEFRPGWHVLGSMDVETGAWSLFKCDSEERCISTEDIWRALTE
jgi:hypothetical protein